MGEGKQQLPVIDDFDEIVTIVRKTEDIYLRYSKGPDADAGRCSRDYEADVDMPGLSVTPVAPEPWWTRPAEDWIARRLCKYSELGDEEERFPWLLTGTAVGNGPDHEPVLTDTQPICRVGDRALDRARALYRERFEVAEDSRSG